MSPLNQEAIIRQTTTDPAAHSDALDFPSTPSPLQRRSSKFSKSSSFLDERYLLPPSRTPSKSELSQFEAFVETAIVSSQKQSTITPSYRTIIDCIRKRNDATMLYRLLVVLRMNGTTLNQLIKYPKQHAELIHFIFRLDPFTVPSKMSNDNAYRTLTDNFTMADAHLHFIVAIVSANSTYLIPALQALWKLLTTSEQGESVGRNQRLHATLATLIRLVPKGSADLFPIVVSGFPYRGRSDVIEYVKLCFVLLDYAPMLESQVLELIIDKALEIDVEIRIKDDGVVELDDEKFIKPNQDGIFQLELEDHITSEVETPTINFSQGQIDELIDDMADKLDSIMLCLFQHIEARIDKDPQAVSIIFQMLLPVFENAILTTHRSKFVQFIVFYICGKAPSSQESPHELNREFAGRLIEAVLDPSLATVTRQSAACYLASFVSRAMYAHSDTACEVVAALLRWAEAYLAVFQDEATTSRRRDDRSICELHALFYTVCQSAFYIMCFRGAETHRLYGEAVNYWGSSQNSNDSPYPELDHIDISPKRWERICSHKLQPLRYCLESVREEFILVAHAFKLLPIELIRDLDFESEQQSSRNKRRGKLISTPVTSLAGRRKTGGVGGLGHGCNPLDSFFPFDPYLLQQSHAYVDPIYRNWEGGLQEMDDEPFLKDADNINDSDDGEDMEENGETDDDGEGNYDSDVNEVPSHMESKKLSSSLENGSHQILPNANGGPTYSFGLNPQEYRQSQSTAWSRALKRPRAPSLAENGSW